MWILELILVILLFTIPFAVIFISLYMTSFEKNKEVRNNVDRLIDNVRLNTDFKGRIRFKKALSLLVKSEYIKKSAFRKAAGIFDKIAAKTPDPLDKAYCLGWAGRCYEDYGDDRTAEKRFNKAAKIAPSDVFVLERLGDYAFSFNSDSADESAGYYKKVLEYNPICYRTYFKLGRLYSSYDEPDKAIDQYQTAIEVNNGYVAPMAEAAIEFAKKGDRKNSLHFFLLAMASDLYEFEKLGDTIESCLK